MGVSKNQGLSKICPRLEKENKALYTVGYRVLWLLRKFSYSTAIISLVDSFVILLRFDAIVGSNTE